MSQGYIEVRRGLEKEDKERFKWIFHRDIRNYFNPTFGLDIVKLEKDLCPDPGDDLNLYERLVATWGKRAAVLVAKILDQEQAMHDLVPNNDHLKSANDHSKHKYQVLIGETYKFRALLEVQGWVVWPFGYKGNSKSGWTIDSLETGLHVCFRKRKSDIVNIVNVLAEEIPSISPDDLKSEEMYMRLSKIVNEE